MALLFLLLASPSIAEPLPMIVRRQVLPTDSSGILSSTVPTPTTPLSTDSSQTSTTILSDTTEFSTVTPSSSPTDTPTESSTIQSESSITSAAESQTPTPPIPPTFTPPRESKHRDNSGAIAGGVIGGLLAFAVLVGIFFFFARRRRFSPGRTRGFGRGPSFPPSPRLNRPWQSDIYEGSALDSAKPHRLDSINGGDPFRAASLRGADDRLRASKEFAAGTAVSVGGSKRNTRSSSKSNVLNVVPGTAYDLNVFRNKADERGHADPSRSQTSFHSVPGEDSSNPAGANGVTRNHSLKRKPAPTYNEEEESSPPRSPNSSKPPVAGTRMGRVRSHSQASSNSRRGVEISGNGDMELNHKGSGQFYGEKEGPVHYLVPDLPSSNMI
ncbi:uncharacterized protein EI90DRAFT_3066959 [Cantharellus anzutake]|uniref:uncharacterized protein n=1 Tax=Cantharellus anzutake TaxID=1750568 RepID=UPI0019066BA4|nr:uncharacterized protein EI90DRAFT_3066959 [Cantharellus anzutake]KAF8327766.1 hypothetical protein EI90DRAFT_3066959 [Cantharellus anzutake]